MHNQQLTKGDRLDLHWISVGLINEQEGANLRPGLAHPHDLEAHDESVESSTGHPADKCRARFCLNRADQL